MSMVILESHSYSNRRMHSLIASQVSDCNLRLSGISVVLTNLTDAIYAQQSVECIQQMAIQTTDAFNIEGIRREF